jgi:prepilin-type N-terminal cleavage/methylation domain-containing protein
LAIIGSRKIMCDRVCHAGKVLRAQGGFTLVEALVTLALAGLAATLAFPAIDRQLTELQQRKDAAIMRADIRAARAEAIRSGRRVDFNSGQIRFFPDGSAQSNDDAIDGATGLLQR